MSGAALIHALQFVENDWIGERRAVTQKENLENHKSISTAGEYERDGSAVSPSSAEENTATLKALEEIVGQLQKLNSANLELRDVNVSLQEQLRETNRDLNELQFRVDTHSESFRPLRVSSSEAPLLWNSINPGGSQHPLLPPKE
tara:strand:+ start:124 stop:558 length:435 start_codon:yes stop_codon:yes gene_type:complete